MDNIDFKKEMALYTKKYFNNSDTNISSIYEPISEVAASLKGIEKASKKNVMQIQSIIENVKNENERLLEELRSLRVERTKQSQLLKRIINCILYMLDQMDDMYNFAVSSGNEHWINSIKGLLKNIQKSINEVGIFEIPALGEIFDEEYHTCVDTVKDTSRRKYEIIEVRKKGYFFNGEVIRPAAVVAVE